MADKKKRSRPPRKRRTASPSRHTPPPEPDETATAQIKRERYVDATPIHSWVLCRHHPAPQSAIAAPEGVEHPAEQGKAKLEVLKVGKAFLDPDGEPWVKPGDYVQTTASYKALSINPDDKNMLMVAGSNIIGIVHFEDIPEDEIEVVSDPSEAKTSQLLNAAGKAITGAN